MVEGRRSSSGLYAPAFDEASNAVKLGVSRVAAVQWESQRTQPSLAMIEKISEALQVAPEYLAFGVGEVSATDDRDPPPMVSS